MITSLRLSAALSLFLVTPAFAASTLLDCKVTSVYGGDFEESLSVEEYPEVSFSRGDKGNLVVGLGGNGDFDTADSDHVKIGLDTATAKSVAFAYADTPAVAYKLEIQSRKIKGSKAKGKKRGIWKRTGNLYQKQGNQAWDPIADVTCKWWDASFKPQPAVLPPGH
jgi:hypothetical protein